jgi:SAM-dependent methyltransferase
VTIRVFISYAKGNSAHTESVRALWHFLRSFGIDARVDLDAIGERQDWSTWAMREIRAARFVIAVASAEYRRQAESPGGDVAARRAEWEAALIRDEIYADLDAAVGRFLPVVLPGGSADGIPSWMGPATHTHYRVDAWTVDGADALLRLLSSQPYEVTPPLGAGAVLTDDTLVRRLADRTPGRNEAMVQADVRQLLALAELGLGEDDLGVPPPSSSPDDRRRIDIRTAHAVVEVRRDLRADGLLMPAETQLARYVAGRGEQVDLALLTDGAQWRLYRRTPDALAHVTTYEVDPAGPSATQLLEWLESALATGRSLHPTPQAIVGKLGVDSPAHRLMAADLAAVYERHRDRPTVAIKRSLWAKLLTTALGTNFTDDDALFVDHTLLVLTAELIGHAVVGIRLDNYRAEQITSGAAFRDVLIWGVVESDFFDWIAEVPEGDRFIRRLARRLTRFQWGEVEHDLMKVLYESIISPQTRHRLGEYYTPDWLAGIIVDECVDDPLHQRVLDPSCGSGTFLFHAIRRYLAVAADAGMTDAAAVQGAVRNVVGFDVHPVAVTLARVTVLLAIGIPRLQAADRPPFTVQVSLADSLRWGRETTLFSYTGLSIPTDDDHRLFVSDPDQITGSRLRFPHRVIADIDAFDRLVDDMAEAARERRHGGPIPKLGAVFRRCNVHEDDQAELVQTFATLCQLHDEGRDHIWGYYVRNIARPAWLARPGNQADVLVGNPPWLAYRYMTEPQQAAFRAMCSERGLWAGASVATNQDLAALFVARCIELYLRPGGRFGCLMPLAALSRRQYAGFRTGCYATGTDTVLVAFDDSWDMHPVKPAFFPIPPCVVLGRRLADGMHAVSLDRPPKLVSGRFDTATSSPKQARMHLGWTTPETTTSVTPRGSPYAKLFSQGATVVPRMLFVVEADDSHPLGPGAGRRAVRSRRSANEKRPWKDLPSLHGMVEQQFVRPLYTGDAILPFRTLTPMEAVIPWNDHRLLDSNDGGLDLYPGLARWWAQAEREWTRNRSSDRFTLLEQLDFRRKLTQQPTTGRGVVYTKSGLYLTSASVVFGRALIDHQLYWARTENHEEARFLTAFLNSSTLTAAVKPLQSRGNFGPRHFDKYVFQLPIPRYDPLDNAHRWLVALAERAEEVAAGVELPNIRFDALRRRIRKALVADGVAADIDAIVRTMLA